MRPRSRTRFSGSCVAALVVVACAVAALPTPAGAAPVKRKVTLQAPASLTFGATLTLKGRATRSPRGTKVFVQISGTGGWRTVTKAKATKQGRWRARVKPTGTGAFRYRALVRRTKVKRGGRSVVLAAATSKPRTVRITERPGPRVSLVSTTPQGTPGNGGSYLWSVRQGPSISSDGRWIAFWSEASNLVAGDTNGVADVFVRDRLSGVTTRVSRSAHTGAYYPQISPNGRYLAYTCSSTAPGTPGLGVYVWDRSTGKTRVVATIQNGSGGTPVVADNGQVAYTNYGPEQAGSRWQNVYSWSPSTSKSTLVSHAYQGSGIADSASTRPQITADGSVIVFRSAADNLVPGEPSDYYHSFAWSRGTGKVTKLSTWVKTGGVQPTISANGRYHALVGSTAADTKSQIYLVDRQTGSRTLVSRTVGGSGGNASSDYPRVSAEGSYVVFESDATDLGSEADLNNTGTNQTDVFIWERATGTVRMVSRSAAGASVPGLHQHGAVSADGRLVVFASYMAGLVPNDSNGLPDVFLWDRRGSTS